MKKHVAILIGVPTPYREPLFERLAESPEFEILVLYCRNHQPGQHWRLSAPRYPVRYLKELAPVRWHELPIISAINLDVWRELSAFRPDALIVYGYASATCLLAILWAQRHGIPLLLRSDSNGLDELAKPRLIKKRFLNWITKRVSAFLAIGTLNSQYWLRYGAKAEKVFTASFSIDNEYFQTQAECYRASRHAIKDQTGWKYPYLLLYVGRLVHLKSVHVLIDAVRRISKRRSDIGLLIVGEGVERKYLEDRARGLPQIFFLGFRDWRELPKYYGVADLFVLPSEREAWGLVVNEAMASGLPVIATRKVGSAHDLIVNGDNGYLVPENDIAALASAIDRACQSKAHLRAMGEKAQRVISNWSYEATLEGFHRALAYCLDRKDFVPQNSGLTEVAWDREINDVAAR